MHRSPGLASIDYVAMRYTWTKLALPIAGGACVWYHVFTIDLYASMPGLERGARSLNTVLGWLGVGAH